jgi:hypothetical protein
LARFDADLDAEACRCKAQGALALAAAAADRLIAAELRLLAERYLSHALELEARRRLIPRPRAPRAVPPPSSDAYRGDN